MKNLPKDYPVQLNPMELEFCKIQAENRQSNKEKDGVPTKNTSNRSETEIHYQGCIGERVVAKALGLYPDLSIEHKSAANGTDDGEFVLEGGFRLDVKFTKYERGKLLVSPNKKDAPIEIYCLVTSSDIEDEYYIRGFVSRQTLFVELNLWPQQPSGRMAYQLHQSQLITLDEAIESSLTPLGKSNPEVPKAS